MKESSQKVTRMKWEQEELRADAEETAAEMTGARGQCFQRWPSLLLWRSPVSSPSLVLQQLTVPVLTLCSWPVFISSERLTSVVTVAVD